MGWNPSYLLRSFSTLPKKVGSFFLFDGILQLFEGILSEKKMTVEFFRYSSLNSVNKSRFEKSNENQLGFLGLNWAHSMYNLRDIINIIIKFLPYYYDQFLLIHHPHPSLFLDFYQMDHNMLNVFGHHCKVFPWQKG